MKKIFIAGLLTLFSLGIAGTSFAVNDISSLNNWYLQNVKVIENSHKDHDKTNHKFHKEHHKDINIQVNCDDKNNK